MQFAVWRRLRFFFRGKYWWVVLLIGIVLIFVGFSISDKHSLLSAAFVGTGTSMLATMLVSLAGPESQATYQKFLQLGVTDFYPNRNMVPYDSWVNWLQGARRSCTLLGQANGEWLNDHRFEAALVSRLSQGVNIQIFFLDPATPEAEVREKEDKQNRPTRDRTRESIRKLWEIRRRLSPAARKHLAIYTYDAIPTVAVTWVDDWMLITHYLAGFSNLTSPALRVESSPDPSCPYMVYAENVDQIRDRFSTKVTDENVSTYIDGEPKQN